MNPHTKYTLGGLLVATLITALGLFAAGCQTIRDNPVIAQGVVQIATYEAIERSGDSIETAENIIAVDEALQSSVDEDGTVTLAAVATLVDAELVDLDLSPTRRAQANLLVSVLAAHIESRIDAGQLDPEALTTVRQVSAWAAEAAQQYLDSRTPTPEALSVPAAPQSTVGAPARDAEPVDMSLWGYLTDRRNREAVRAHYAAERMTAEDRERARALHALAEATDPETGEVDGDTYWRLRGGRGDNLDL